MYFAHVIYLHVHVNPSTCELYCSEQCTGCRGESFPKNSLNCARISVIVLTDFRMSLCYTILVSRECGNLLLSCAVQLYKMGSGKNGGLAFHPGGVVVELFLGALCYRNQDKFHPDVPWDQALQWRVGGKKMG